MHLKSLNDLQQQKLCVGKHVPAKADKTRERDGEDGVCMGGRSVRVCLEGRVASDWGEIRQAVAAPAPDQHALGQNARRRPQRTLLRRVLVPCEGPAKGERWWCGGRRGAEGKSKTDTRWSCDHQKPLVLPNKNPLTAAHLDKMDGVAQRAWIVNTGVLRSGRDCARKGTGEGRKMGVTGGLSCSRW